jgi:hypothetical protein
MTNSEYDTLATVAGALGLAVFVITLVLIYGSKR